MAHECLNPICTPYCSGVRCISDIVKVGRFGDHFFIQKRPVGERVTESQFDVDLFSPLHFKATKSLRQDHCPNVAWLRPTNDQPRFSNRQQIDHFNVERVGQIEADIKAYSRERSDDGYFRRVQRDMRNYDKRMTTWHDSQVTQCDVMPGHVKMILEARTHAGDQCQHTFHKNFEDLKNCYRGYYLVHFPQCKSIEDYRQLTKHCSRIRAKNVQRPMLRSIRAYEEKNELFDVHIRMECRKRKHEDYQDLDSPSDEEGCYPDDIKRRRTEHEGFDVYGDTSFEDPEIPDESGWMNPGNQPGYERIDNSGFSRVQQTRVAQYNYDHVDGHYNIYQPQSGAGWNTYAPPSGWRQQ